MSDLIVGCPVSHRAWVLPQWREHVVAAAREANIRKLEFAFVADPGDHETLDVIHRFPEPAYIAFIEDGRAADSRQWNRERYEHMAMLRNRLLNLVRQLLPSWFLSLDSDILIHPKALGNMLDSAVRFDVVGGRTYMTPSGTACPSWGFFTRDGGIRRLDAEGIFGVEIVMAIKLLTPRAYYVDYEPHSHGEDLGFSQNCRKAGLELGVDARVVSKHVMSPEQLERVDERCGF